jgi:hypothetical protein
MGDQDQTTTGTTTTEPDLSEPAADILEDRDFAPGIVEQVRYGGYDEGTFTKHRMNVIEEADPTLAEKIREAMKEQTAREAAEEAQRIAQAQLDALDDQQRDEALAALRDQAAAEAEDEIEWDVEVGRDDRGLREVTIGPNVAAARALADTFASHESSPAEALAAWDNADPVTRTIAEAAFKTAPIDFDIDEVLGRGGSS